MLHKLTYYIRLPFKPLRQTIKGIHCVCVVFFFCNCLMRWGTACPAQWTSEVFSSTVFVLCTLFLCEPSVKTPLAVACELLLLPKWEFCRAAVSVDRNAAAAAALYIWNKRNKNNLSCWSRALFLSQGGAVEPRCRGPIHQVDPVETSSLFVSLNSQPSTLGATNVAQSPRFFGSVPAFSFKHTCCGCVAINNDSWIIHRELRCNCSFCFCW